MMNDGGAERMVKNNKVEWWMILAIVIMMIFVIVTFLFFFFISNGEQMIETLNKATVKDGYEILMDAKAQFPDLAVTEYEQTDTTVSINFKYYETILEKDINLMDYSYQVKEHLEKYLKEHEDNYIVTGKRQVTLRFPNIVYSNINPQETFEYASEFKHVSYKYSDISAQEFLKDISCIKSAASLTFMDEGITVTFDEAADFSPLLAINGLKYLSIEENRLTANQKESLKKLCEEKDIKLSIK